MPQDLLNSRAPLLYASLIPFSIALSCPFGKAIMPDEHDMNSVRPHDALLCGL